MIATAVHRAAGHEREDALAIFAENWAERAFVKPLQGSRGDFAQVVDGESMLVRYLDEVSPYYDSILIQPVASGDEYRVFLLDDEVVYTARKYPPSVVGDGISSIRELLAAHNEALRSRGLSPVAIDERDASLDVVPAKGARWEIPGRMNLSAGGTMVLQAAIAPAALTLATARPRARSDFASRPWTCSQMSAARPMPMRVIEVNANPSIRLLEQSGRADLILKIWRHTFSAMGLLGV